MLGAVRSACAILLTIFWASLGILTWPLSPSGRLYLWYARIWARMVLGVSGVRWDAKAPDGIDPGRPAIFMANHESLYDILALYASIPTPVRMIAKKELARIPVFGWSMWLAGFVFVDRSRRQTAVASLARAAEAVRLGKSLVVFPEGTRGDGTTLGPFKRGAFHLAVGAAVPVVPVGIAGTAAVLPRGTSRPRPGPVSIRFGAPILVEAGAPDAREALCGRVRDEIARLLAQARADIVEAGDVPASGEAGAPGER